MKLPSIEPILQWLRIQKIKKHLIMGGVLVDVGCDTPPVLLNRYKDRMKKCIGLDSIAKTSKCGNVEIFHQEIRKEIKLPNETAHTITMLAVLEHLKYPQDVLHECYRILKPGGRVLITVPSPRNELILDVFAKVGLVRKEMIDQHENYFTCDELKHILLRAGFIDLKVEPFELGYNIFAFGTKNDK